MRIGLLVLLGLMVSVGCQSRPPDFLPRRPTSKKVIKPAVAVMTFENRANYAGKWNLGEGMADVLVTKLLTTDMVTVLERAELDDVVNEINRQGQGHFREEGKVNRGRLKSAQYIIYGAVTDFTIGGGASGWVGSGRNRGGGGRQVAVVALHLRVADVESGEIITSASGKGTAAASRLEATANYQGIQFGGEAFSRTPFGRATEKAMNKALGQVLKALPVEFWKPVIAEVAQDIVVINGGENVGLIPGQYFYVRSEGRSITDPVTGNVIERVPGRVVGKVQITTVKKRSARARILKGLAERGNALEPTRQ